MARVYTLPPIPGVKDLNTLMAFLMDKEEYDTRLQALTGLEEEINAMILKVGPAEEIETLHAQATKHLDEATATLKDAKAKAKSIVAEAENKADAVAAQVAEEGEHMREHASVLASQQDEFDTFKAEQENLLAEWEVKLKGREDAAAALHKSAQATLEEYTKKLAALKGLVS